MLEYTLYVQETWARLLELFALHFCSSMYTLCQLSHSVHGPSLWPAHCFGTLPDSLTDPDLGRDNFRRLLKMHLSTLYSTFCISDMFQDNTAYKLTYLLTYLYQARHERQIASHGAVFKAKIETRAPTICNWK